MRSIRQPPGVHWLAREDLRPGGGVKLPDIIDADAIDLLADRLRSALQIEMHLTLAFEHAFRLGEKRVSAEVVEQVLSRAIDELEPTLTRNGYDAPALTSLLRPSLPRCATSSPARSPQIAHASSPSSSASSACRC